MEEPGLNRFPIPSNGQTGVDNDTSPIFHATNPWANSVAQNGTSARARSGSVRRKSEVPRPVGQHGTPGSVPPHLTSTASTTISTSRNRRQSLAQTPSTSAAPTSRAPRKSIGPGSLPLNGPSSIVSSRRPSFTVRKASADVSAHSLPRSQTQNLDPNHGDEINFSRNLRSLKTKSMQPLSREPRDNFLSALDVDGHHAVRTPVKSHPADATTPSSTKRVSVMPPHAHGLGARTISPTDARRFKRLSTAPTAPPLPHTPPTQTAEPAPVRPRSSAQSPSYIPRKSVTPSSSRTTPDPNRKSYSSGLSVSSSTSYNSLRNSSSSLQPRLSQNLSTSRLPTPKPRSEQHGGGSNQEEVPPVPAIPKAYESPKGDVEPPPPQVIPRKSSLPLDVGFLKTTRDSDSDANTALSSIGDELANISSGGDLKTPEAKSKPPAATVLKKHLQPLKLPPLNLLPLSTPMTNKIEALKDRDHHHDLKSYTPSAQFLSKTPSTPMTASKANFWSTSDDDDPIPFAQIRSSTSHFGISTSAALRTASSSSALASFEQSNLGRTMSPYISYTLPKSNSDYHFLQQKVSGDYSQKHLQPSRLTGPRPQTETSAFSSPATETPSQISTPSEPDTSMGTGSSALRSKLNLARQQSNPQSQPEASSTVASKYESMPPPKLPASATWNSLSTVKSISPTLKPTYLKSRRQSSISGATNAAVRKPSFSGDQNPTLHPSPAHESKAAEPAPRLSGSLLSPVHKIISSAKSSAAASKLRSTDSNAEPDEIVADEEMRRLASKRKEFEVAAKGLDELRRKAVPKDCVTPAQALKMAHLNIFERGEIIDFKDIYFCGTQNAKKHVGDLHSQSYNFGYDDERGDYNIVIGDHLAYRYEVVDLLGKGSFGQVVRCIDHKTGTLVAVKIIRNKKRFHQQAIVEVNILQKLKEWDPHRRHSVVNFTQSFYFRGHFCISTELLGMNLYEFTKAHDFKGFNLKLIRRFTKQMLGCLTLLHAKKVIHCDLKPENILLVHPLSSEIKVIDFGSSCFENEKVYTYIQSRFYRSPEVILGMSYGMPIDMWSLGCILAELYTGYPIFPGENEQEQLACIMEIFGPPEKHLIEKSTRKKLFFDSLGKPRLTVSSKGRRRRPSSKDLRQVLKCDDEAFLDFIARCLRWDPLRRLTPHDAGSHEFLTGIKAPVRSRTYTFSTSSPSKRYHATTTTSSASRPLPEPPATSLKAGSFRNRDVSGSSPSKPTIAKRQTVSGMPTSTPAKRASHTTVSGTGLPRVATRSISGKPDLATAAAATSLVGGQPC
ncbi:hypothetical protein ASPZODRAFT_1279823 [Penicilliopsis zonata CBS 506.65]|uniref:dual-specificity kinase n=1 Tax=Penicilliopsis zonata CBS 506.65 TaxID=1073090 RepID=A0A1L9S6V6_9EURO|nr:hypothetical protein ASPZODRAFT_1279823 [Penicilliopsis zonata CBS 506.65]OJJ42875.1 hypothetical protein ASPZODRAFT_1279823 [Penicilliopsis zonata CBS 506.65]